MKKLGTKPLGAKQSEGKPPFELLDAYALEHVARVLAYGEKKYGAFNWRRGLTQRQTLGAALRHIFAHLDGEDGDESGELHLAHAMCEIMFALRMWRDRNDLDDRYKGEEDD